MAHDTENGQQRGIRGSYPARGGLPGEVRQRLVEQHERFGGLSWPAAFFGWLSANGLAVLLVALLSASGVALGLTRGTSAGEQAGTMGLAGGVALLVLLAIAYTAGGYVAGRMARFDGAHQGIGVWLIGLLVVVALAAVAALLGSEYNVLALVDLPRIPVGEGTATTGGLIALVASALVTLVAAVLGGLAGARYHHRIDRTGLGLD